MHWGKHSAFLSHLLKGKFTCKYTGSNPWITVSQMFKNLVISQTNTKSTVTEELLGDEFQGRDNMHLPKACS